MRPTARSRWRHVASALALAAWAPAVVLFVLVGWAAAGLALRGVERAPISDLGGAFVTAAYSLGGAAALLGLTALAVPAGRRGRLAVAGLAWGATTAMLLATRRVDGWPLVSAAAVALAIAGGACRELARGLRAG